MKVVNSIHCKEIQKNILLTQSSFALSKESIHGTFILSFKKQTTQ